MTATMDPYPYVKGFAWITIIALCCSICTNFWVPMLVGAAIVALLVKIALPSR